MCIVHSQPINGSPSNRGFAGDKSAVSAPFEMIVPPLPPGAEKRLFSSCLGINAGRVITFG
jgi:hypothetical protein